MFKHYTNEDFLNTLDLKLNPNRLVVKPLYWLNRPLRYGEASYYRNNFKTIFYRGLLATEFHRFFYKLKKEFEFEEDVVELKSYSYNEDGVIHSEEVLGLLNIFTDEDKIVDIFIEDIYYSMIYKNNRFYTIKTSNNIIIPFNLDGRDINNINNLDIAKESLLAFYGNVFLDNTVTLIIYAPNAQVYERLYFTVNDLKKLLHDVDLSRWRMSIISDKYNVIKIEPFIKYNASAEEQLINLKAALKLR